MILRKSSSLKSISLRLDVQLKFTDIQILLSLFTGEYFEVKNLVKSSVFLLKSDSSLLSISRGGIKGIFLLIDQYVFQLV